MEIRAFHSCTPRCAGLRVITWYLVNRTGQKNDRHTPAAEDAGPRDFALRRELATCADDGGHRRRIVFLKADDER